MDGNNKAAVKRALAEIASGTPPKDYESVLERFSKALAWDNMWNDLVPDLGEDDTQYNYDLREKMSDYLADAG